MSYTSESISKMLSKATAGYKHTKGLMKRLEQLRPHKLDQIVHNLHVKEFAKINCLECANCCKTISPSICDSDVRRMASAVRLKVTEFIDEYLIPDTDNDFIFKRTPCPFLAEDNCCRIYQSRPRACREYPHTNRRRMYQILHLTVRNTRVCPAVFNIVEKLKI